MDERALEAPQERAGESCRPGYARAVAAVIL
jgi:hypothetical protein